MFKLKTLKNRLILTSIGGLCFLIYTVYLFTVILDNAKQLFFIVPIIITIIVVTNVVEYYKFKKTSETDSDIKKYPIILIVLWFLGMGMFFFYFTTSMKYGGSATSATKAAELFEGYEEGKYYLSSHGDYTEVSFEVWNYIRILKSITDPLFYVMFVSNMAYQFKIRRDKKQLKGPSL